MLYFITFLLAFSLSVQAEDIPFGHTFQQESSEINWKEIDTEKFRILFPKENYVEARRLGNVLETIWDTNPHGLNVKSEKIPFVLRRQSAISNGFVAFSPRHSEFFLTPYMTPELSTLKWLDILAIHEFRHVNQQTKVLEESGKGFSFFLGELGHSLAWIISQPLWFAEGDAVYTETQFTNSGRGRMESFLRGVRATIQSGRKYTYDQWYLGEAKEYSPNHYQVGYLILSYLKYRFGEDAVSRMISLSLKSSLNFWSMQNAIHSTTGYKMDTIVADMLKDLKENWDKVDSDFTPSKFELIAHQGNKSTFTNYSFVQPLKGNKFFAVKKGHGNIEEFILLDEGKEEYLLYPKLTIKLKPRLKENMLVWSDIELDSRWKLKSYSSIFTYNFDTEEIERVTDSGKYYAPDINLEKKIIAVRVKKTQGLELVNVTDNKLLYESKGLILSPIWAGSNQVAFLERTENGKTDLQVLSLDSMQIETLIKETKENISYLSFGEGRVFYQSDLSGVSDIFSIGLEDKKVLRHTKSKYGALYPSFKNDSLYYSEYTENGLIPVKTPIQNFEIKEQRRYFSYLDKTNIIKTNILENVEKKEYQVEEYRSSKDALNFHSWFFVPLIFGNFYSFSANSSNYLNTLSLSTGASFNLNNGSSNLFGILSYAGLYPILDIGVQKSNKVDVYNPKKPNEVKDDYSELRIEIGPRFKWSFLQRGYRSLLSLDFKKSFTEQEGRRLLPRGTQKNIPYTSERVSLVYSFLKNQSLLDIKPEKGFSFLAEKQRGKSLDKKVDQKGDSFSFVGRVYLPGFWNHHSLNIALEHSDQLRNNYLYDVLTSYSRGYKTEDQSILNKATLNYAFVLGYPEKSLSDWVYFRRIAMNLFFDHTNAEDIAFGKRELNSIGVEFTFLNNYFRKKLLLFDLGLRFSHRYLDSKNEAGIFLSSTTTF